MRDSKIEWCDATFNPWWGCERVSPACAHCYADTFANRLGMDIWDDKRKDGSLAPHAFRFFGDKHWDEPLKWALTLPAKLGRRPRVFCASMADVFEERDELEEHRVRLFSLIAATPELDWLVLTKRPEFARDWLPDGGGFVFPNIWLGVSIENARFTWRADVLRETPAAVRFISAEPLLGSLFEETRVMARASGDGETGSLPQETGWLPDAHRRRAPLDLTGIDWVIIGGESGGKARPFHLEHASEIVDACYSQCAGCAERRRRAAVHSGHACEGRPSVFVKQLGAHPIQTLDCRSVSIIPNDIRHYPLKLRDRKGGDMDEWPADLRIREFPTSAAALA